MDSYEKLEGLNEALTRIAEEYGVLDEPGMDEVLDDLTHEVADRMGIVKRLSLTKTEAPKEPSLMVRAEGGPVDLYCNTCERFVPLDQLWITGQHGADKDKSDHRIWEKP
jgi:hypothetical protein